MKRVALVLADSITYAGGNVNALVYSMHMQMQVYIHDRKLVSLKVTGAMFRRQCSEGVDGVSISERHNA